MNTCRISPTLSSVTPNKVRELLSVREILLVKLNPFLHVKNPVDDFSPTGFV